MLKKLLLEIDSFVIFLVIDELYFFLESSLGLFLFFVFLIIKYI